MIRKFDLHLISDSTCETLRTISGSLVRHFSDIEAEEKYWSFILTEEDLDKIFDSIVIGSSVIIYTIVPANVRQYLKDRTMELNIPCIPVLSHAIRELSSFLGTTPHGKPGRPHVISDEYFRRVEAMNYTLLHDDGQNLHNIEEADIILIGVSRTSKTPTSMYLSYRGYKVVNIPFISGTDFPLDLSILKKKNVIGLDIGVDRLMEIRKSRMSDIISSNQNKGYIGFEAVMEELKEARDFFRRNEIFVLDVTMTSIEEVAGRILKCIF